MVNEKFLLSLFLVTSLLAETTIAKTEFLAAFCSRGENYTKTSSFQTNLETALTIRTTDIDYGFYNFSGGRNSDRVDVIGLCRGDINPRACRSCLDDSGEDLRRRCPNQKEAIGWADDCMIRYSNRSILHMNQTLPAIFMFNLKNASDPTLFNKAVRGLLDNLRAKAAAGGSKLKYATGHMNSTRSSEKIFGLVQCTPDLSPAQCTDCLTGAFKVLPQCCDGKIGGRVLGPSCNFRYETNRFYDQTTLPDAPAPAPAPQAAAPPPSNGRITSSPVSSTPGDGFPPPPPPQGGGGNRNLGLFHLSTVMAATLLAILIF